MKLLIIPFVALLVLIEATNKINVQELRCLVCKATIDELSDAVKSIDPSKKIDLGGYQLDEGGNYKRKSVSQAKSEIHLSELIDDICNKMDDYVRARYKTNGKLMLLKLIIDGGMNPAMSDVDIVQDDDLNKSLKYYCEGIMEEYEDDIIKHFQNDTENVQDVICRLETGLCRDKAREEL